MALKLDGDEYGVPYSSVCGFCLHLSDALGHTCAAFPGGIPPEIWLGRHDHKTPYPGDNGIQFERRSVPEREDVQAQGTGPKMPLAEGEPNLTGAVYIGDISAGDNGDWIKRARSGQSQREDLAAHHTIMARHYAAQGDSEAAAREAGEAASLLGQRADIDPTTPPKPEGAEPDAL